MTYALIVNDTIQATGNLPRGADADGQWIEPLTPDNAHLAGWFLVVETVRPADTDTHTQDRTIELVNGTPTEVWTQRAWTVDELAARAAEANRSTLTDPTTLESRLDRLAAYTTDIEVTTALARANNTSISTQDMNRLLKVILRRQQRQDTLIALLARLVDPALLADITDTVEPA